MINGYGRLLKLCGFEPQKKSDELRVTFAEREAAEAWDVRPCVLM